MAALAAREGGRKAWRLRETEDRTGALRMHLFRATRRQRQAKRMDDLADANDAITEATGALTTDDGTGKVTVTFPAPARPHANRRRRKSSGSSTNMNSVQYSTAKPASDNRPTNSRRA